MTSTKTVGISTAGRGNAVPGIYASDAAGITLPEDQSFIVAALVRFNGVPQSSIDNLNATVASQYDGVNTGWRLVVSSQYADPPAAGGTDQLYTNPLFGVSFVIGDGLGIDFAQAQVPAGQLLGRWCVIHGVWDASDSSIRVGVNGVLGGDQARTFVNAPATPTRLLNLTVSGDTQPCPFSYLSVASVGIKSFANTVSMDDVRANLQMLVSNTFDYHFALKTSGQFDDDNTIFGTGFDYQWNPGADAVAEAPATLINRGIGAAAPLTRTGAATDYTLNVSNTFYAGGVDLSLTLPL